MLQQAPLAVAPVWAGGSGAHPAVWHTAECLEFWNEWRIFLCAGDAVKYEYIFSMRE